MNKIVLSILVLLFSGCGIFKTEIRWTDLPDEYYAIPLYAKYLQGVRIILDPGHGGQGDIPGYKRGPSGVREAEINLRVVLYLKEFLEEAGAEVLLTRSDDSYVSLADRADFANHSDADFMLSIHHNASGNPQTNYTSIFYHKRADLSPASIDLARNMYFGLVEALHLPQISADGLHSDQLIFPDGFGLLRRCKIPAVLVESSFFSNRKEEKRLTKKNYNKREAYGLFLGLARYMAGGIPYAKLILPDNGYSRVKTPDIQFKLFDGLRERGGRDFSRFRIFTNSIGARMNGRTIIPEFNQANETIFFLVDTILTNGVHTIELLFQNIYKNHNFPEKHEIIVASPCKVIRHDSPIYKFPVHGDGFIPVDVNFYDCDSIPVWDGTIVNIWSDNAKIDRVNSSLSNGKCRVNVFPQTKSDSLWIYSSADSCIDSIKIHIVSEYLTILEGRISNPLNDSLLSQVEIYNRDTLLAKTDEYGTFFITDIQPGIYQLKLDKKGFFSCFDTIMVKANWVNRFNLQLTPVDSGIFFGETIIFDIPSSGNEDITIIDTLNQFDFNFNLAKLTTDSLKFAGAEPVMIIESRVMILSLAERIEKVNRIEKGWYMRITASPSLIDSNVIHITVYPGNKQARMIAESLLDVFKKQDYRIEITESTVIPEVRNTNKTALAVDLMIMGNQKAEQIVNWFYSGLRDYYSHAKTQRIEEKIKKISH